MINSLIKIPFSATLISADFDFNNYRHVVEKEILLILKESTFYVTQNSLDFDIENIAAASVSIIASSNISSDRYISNYEKILYSLNKKYFINGYETFSLSTSKKLWISEFDLKFLEMEHKSLC